MSKVRTRFAPSPTGIPHVGNLRSALFNYLHAKHSKGVFVLRLEDTDRERLVPESVEAIKESMQWLGLEWNEGIDAGGKHGPYVQSERLELYKKYADELLEKGLAYKDFTSSERLAKLREDAINSKRPFKFNKKMATLDGDDKDPHVIRFQIQPGEAVEWDDLVQGRQSWQREVLDDFVAIKSDGYPTYNFAMVVDDHLMEISHIFRGQEFLATTPKQILVFEAFGWNVPEFVHLPQVLGSDKAKLSKRHGAQSALEYRDQGYLPETVFNYLASLGFNDGTTQEIYTQDELIKAFSLDRIQSSPAIFDPERLEWMNGVYIRELKVDELLERVVDFWPAEAKNFDDKYKKRVLELTQERLKFFAELSELTDFFFADPKIKSEDFEVKQLRGVDVHLNLSQTREAVSEIDKFNEQSLEETLRNLADSLGIKAGTLFTAIRIAVTGKTASPGLFETLTVVGKEAVIRRLQAAIRVVKA